MENILYLDDYINLYNKNENKIIIYKPYKNTLKNGKIIDRSKFIKKFNKLLEEYHLKNNFFNNSISIVISNDITEEDKKLFLEIFDELNYKNIKFIREIEYLKINKNSLYICFNNSYFYIYNVNELGKIEMNIFALNKLTKKFIVDILKFYQKKIIYIFGKNYQELDNILKNKDLEYYYFEESDNLILKIILK